MGIEAPRRLFRAVFRHLLACSGNNKGTRDMTASANTTPDRARRIRGVAERLDISERQAWRLVKDGKIKASKLGPRCTRVFDSEIERYIAAQLATAA
jgi:predicted DNA-binding transcriptional regulator AlpA